MYEAHYNILLSDVNATDAQVCVESETELQDKVMHRAAYDSSLKFATGTAVIEYDEASKSEEDVCVGAVHEGSFGGWLRSVFSAGEERLQGDLKTWGRVLGARPFFAGNPRFSSISRLRSHPVVAKVSSILKKHQMYAT